MISCDVSEQVMRKVEALSAYCSQLPLERDMFPEFLLQEMFGREHFVAAPTGQAALIWTRACQYLCMTQSEAHRQRPHSRADGAAPASLRLATLSADIYRLW